jgi:hypothetical protein
MNYKNLSWWLICLSISASEYMKHTTPLHAASVIFLLCCHTAVLARLSKYESNEVHSIWVSKCYFFYSRSLLAIECISKSALCEWAGSSDQALSIHEMEIHGSPWTRAMAMDQFTRHSDRHVREPTFKRHHEFTTRFLLTQSTPALSKLAQLIAWSQRRKTSTPPATEGQTIYSSRRVTRNTFTKASRHRVQVPQYFCSRVYVLHRMLTLKLHQSVWSQITWLQLTGGFWTKRVTRTSSGKADKFSRWRGHKSSDSNCRDISS